MYTHPEMYNPDDLNKRAFVSFYYEGTRYRQYHGKALGINCNPNGAGTLAARTRELKRLERAVYRALENGWKPGIEEKKLCTSKEAIQIAGLLFEKEAFSGTYRRDIRTVCNQFTTYLEGTNLHKLPLNQVKPEHIEGFLAGYQSSGTYYMNKRRMLGAVLSRLVKMGYLTANPIPSTSKRKAKAKLNLAFKPDQLLKVLSFLKAENENLYLCALMMYGTLLRPHREIRLLKRENISTDLTSIILDGYHNKSGRIRKTAIPDYVYKALVEKGVDKLPPGCNIFTGEVEPFNEYYFNLCWGRVKKKLLKQGTITPEQTLYSFRHSAAVDVFTRTQNLKVLQTLMGHSNLNVSMVYLRSLDTVDITDENLLPKLKM